MMPRQICKLPSAVACAAWLALSLTGAAVSAQEAPDAEGAVPEDERIVLGALSYRVHCLSCHGSSAVGDGPVAEQLKIVPADLTRLSEQHGGEFPSDRVYRAIDGRDQIRSHGSREMPVWGIGFQDRGRDEDQEAAVRSKIGDLVAYLKSIQADGQ